MMQECDVAVDPAKLDKSALFFARRRPAPPLFFALWMPPKEFDVLELNLELESKLPNSAAGG
jgi:hypothetical protein